MSTLRILGLIFVSVLISDKARAESTILDNQKDLTPTASEKSFSIQIPLGSGNVIQSDNQVTAQRRLSLEDFFLNRQQPEQEQPAAPEQAPVAQFQVQQQDPNSVLLVRDAQFPSTRGGLVSRLLMARRMLRLRRIARRLTLIPRLMGLGLRPLLNRVALGSQSPLSLFSNRIGESYDPRDYVFGSKGFSYKNATTGTQHRDTNADQVQEQTRGYPVESEPYYDSNYDTLDNSNYDSQDLNGLKKQEEILNSLTDEQQILLLQQLQTYQNQLNQLQQQLNNPSNNINEQNSQNQGQLLNVRPVQFQKPEQNYQPTQPAQPVQYQQEQQNQLRQVPQIQQNQNEQVAQGFNAQQIQQIRLLQEQLLREQQLQQQLQELQLNQQSKNLQQHQKLANIDPENNFQDQNNFHGQNNFQSQNNFQGQGSNHGQNSFQGQSNIPAQNNFHGQDNQQQYIQQNIQATESNTVGDRTEGSAYSSPISIGGGGNTGNTIGVGINVGIRPPAVDVQVTKPVAPVIKPFPPLVNPIAPPKPAPAAPAVEPLIPVGIFPKPMLNLRGRLFFGAEAGKGVGIKTGAGR